MTISVLKRVFRHVRYVVWAVGVGSVVLSAAVMLPSLATIKAIVFSGSISLTAKTSFLIGLYGSLMSNFTFWSALLVVVTAVLFGINIALLTFYIRRRQESSGGKAAQLASLGGIVSAALGIGCAACGSVVLTALLGLFGAGGLLLLLPFHGVEFGIVGLVLLILSIRYLVKRINDPIVCPAKLGSASVDGA